MALEVLHVALLRITPVSALYLLYCTRTAQYSTLQYSTVSALSVQFVQSKYRVLIKISMRAVSNELVGRAAS